MTLLCVAPAVIDCVLNAEILRHAGQYRPLKYFLVQLVMGWAQQKVCCGVYVDVESASAAYG